MATRRSFISQLGVLAAAGPFLTEAALSQQARAKEPNASAIAWLDGNENPAGPPQSAIDAIRRGAAEVGRYHIEELDGFAAALAASEQIKPQQVLTGAGSGDAIVAAICAFASSTRPVITAAPSYDIVLNLARKLGKHLIEIPLTPQWAYPVRELAAAAEKAGGGLIYLVNPNNPTSSLTPDADVEWLATHLPPDTVLLADEAYLEFVDPDKVTSAIRHVREGRNVIVSRTFSKIYGMAGIRAGFCCARAELITEMNDFMGNMVPLLGMRAALAALAEKTTLVPQRRTHNARVRSQLCAWLRSEGVPYIEPHANFVMVDVGRDVKTFGSAMREKGVAVGRQFPPLTNMLRVTVGTDDDMRRFRDAFRQVRSAAAWRTQDRCPTLRA